MTPTTMRAARLYGIGDLRLETLAVPEPAAEELLVRIEACGVCPTDARAYSAGVRNGTYPFNPGHEWVGRVEATGDGVSGWERGRRVYGDTYAGYAEFALLSTRPDAWSYGPLAVPDELPRDRAVFVEPLADCLHAVHDQARVRPGERVVVLGAGQMGLQMVLSASVAGARVTAVEPIAERRRLALLFGAEQALAADEWREGEDGTDALIVTVGDPGVVSRALAAAKPGGRVVLFAGFGGRSEALVDLNQVHYREIALIGSEWIGAPPNQRRERYDEALALLASGAAPLERLVTAHCGLDGIEAALAAHRARRGLKTVIVP